GADRFLVFLYVLERALPAAAYFVAAGHEGHQQTRLVVDLAVLDELRADLCGDADRGLGEVARLHCSARGRGPVGDAGGDGADGEVLAHAVRRLPVEPLLESGDDGRARRHEPRGNTDRVAHRCYCTDSYDGGAYRGDGGAYADGASDRAKGCPYYRPKNGRRNDRHSYNDDDDQDLDELL